MKRLIGIVVAICLLSAIFIWIEKNTLRSITLTSPRNTAMYNKVDVSIAKPAPVYIEYTEKKTGKSYRTRTSPADTLHHLDLFLLKANTEYTYRVVIDNIFYDFDKATLRPESKKALDEMIKMLNDNPNVTIELGAHTDRKGTDQYNERLAQRRAQSVVDYLIAGGIEAARLEAKGYGESVPKTINKKMAKQFDFLKEGDVLTEEFILALPPEQQEIADQINRRTEFKVLRTNYNLF